MEVLNEEEEYNWREVHLPSLIPVVPQPELERETGERRRGRDILIAIDHGPNSKHAFDWALIHLCRLADTIHLVHAVSSSPLFLFSSSKSLILSSIFALIDFFFQAWKMILSMRWLKGLWRSLLWRLSRLLWWVIYKQYSFFRDQSIIYSCLKYLLICVELGEECGSDCRRWSR